MEDCGGWKQTNMTRPGRKNAWHYWGQQGKRIRAVLEGVDPDDRWAAHKRWEEHLANVMQFPFEPVKKMIGGFRIVGVSSLLVCEFPKYAFADSQRSRVFCHNA